MEKVITSTKHPLIKQIGKLQNDRAYRFQERLIVVEGKKLVEEISSICKPIHLLVVKPVAVPHILVTEEVMRRASQLENPEGFLAVVPFPENSLPKSLHHLLVLDGVSDPGNLGTLLRTALGLGWQGVFLLPGCCDPFNDKAIRAAKGATFHLPMQTGSWQDLEKLHLTPVGADLRGEKLEQFAPPKKIALILGAEGSGLSEESKRRIQPVTIPLSSSVESLNVGVAGAILMYVMRP